jgi:translation initiation factor 1
MSKRRTTPPAEPEAQSAPRPTLGDVLKAKLPALGPLPPGPSATPASSTVPPEPEPRGLLAGQAKLVVRRESKGRGGKTVTVIEGLNAPASLLETLAQKCRQGLGCGSAVERTEARPGTSSTVRVVVQGDQTARLPALLDKLGAPRVIVGN